MQRTLTGGFRLTTSKGMELYQAGCDSSATSYQPEKQHTDKAD